MSGRGYRVGVVGATGAVGSTLLQVLAERNFPAAEVVAFASERSAGKRVAFRDGELECRVLSDEAIEGLDLVLSSAGGAISAEWAPRFVAAGAVVIDNTSFWRLHEDVPLVISEVNPDAAERHNGLIANPNCSTMQMVVALAPIERTVGIERIIISTYQSVSGTGQRAVDELEAQAHALLHGAEPPPPEVYPHRIAFNVVPQVETFKDGDAYTTEERKLMAETRKILELGDELGISATCVRVPVFVGHSQSVNVQTRDPLSPEECRELLSAAPGTLVVDAPGEGVYPLATDVAGRDEVLVGRIRRDPSNPRCLNLWIVGDNLRKGAATNAIQVAEVLHQRDLIRVPAGAAALAV
ncbi:MAG: aspartate-semialdehyde dehydrogenase [Solirubrobacterales bacterium]|jgi:aspartate-semialdehyde dehydrogenase|nr:aspartate-semialdehyde dehydrogenase [Solirubrobacterales bacterium]